jgi:hypothetical protein
MGVLAVAAVALSLLALVACVLVLRGQWRVRRAYTAFTGGRREDVLLLLERHIAEVAGLRADVSALRAAQAGAVSRVGTVRYDAFRDMGGRLSFSTALLDEHGDGVVLTAINGRTDTRSYAKPISAWDSSHNLSEEERSAIALARGSRGAPSPAEVA